MTLTIVISPSARTGELAATFTSDDPRITAWTRQYRTRDPMRALADALAELRDVSANGEESRTGVSYTAPNDGVLTVTIAGGRSGRG